MLCEYGCGNQAIFELKNGKHICKDSPNRCPVIRKKNKTKKQIHYRFVNPKDNPANIKVECYYCKKQISMSNIKKHTDSCYLNPINLKLCPICSKPIKDYKNNKTCSSKCARKYFSDMYLEFASMSWKDRSPNYREICFDNHDKVCIICGEKNIVEVHHFDGNHENDDPKNLIPLCSTHHKYIGSKFEKLIINEINEYHKNYSKH